MKPRKTWSVGDKTFETYAEALREAADRRRASLLEEVAWTVGANIPEGLCDDESIQIIVNALLKNFNITRKKGASRVES